MDFRLEARLKLLRISDENCSPSVNMLTAVRSTLQFTNNLMHLLAHIGENEREISKVFFVKAMIIKQCVVPAY